MRRTADHPARSPGALLAGAWLLAVAAITVLQRTDGLSAGDLASSPDRLLHGGVWTLATSSLVIQGPPLGQFLMLVAVTAWFVGRFGAAAFWIVAVVGHVGTTLATYVGIGLLWLVSRSTADRLLDAPDFGISAILAAAIGGLAVAGWMVGGPRRRVSVAGGATLLAAFVAAVPLDGELSDVEHLVAYLGGAVCAAVLLRHLELGLRNAD